MCRNINHYAIPNTDFFQYIGDGKQYINFKLPLSIHPPPFGPFLICFVSNFFKNIQYPELSSAHFINIVLSILTLLNIFLILYKYSPSLSLLTVFLVATNKIYILNSLNVTNEIIYGFFLTLNIFLYQKKPNWFAYLLSGLLFLIRYESIVFPISIFIVEFIFNRKQFKIKNLIISFSPIVIWLLILNFHSTGNSIIQNAYINEITSGLKNIPNLKPIKELIDILLFNPIDVLYFNLVGATNFNTIPRTIIGYLFPISIFVLFLISFFKSKKSPIIKIIFLTMIFHLIFLTLFPNYAIRYQIPIIWMLYLLIIDRYHKGIKKLIIFSLIGFNLFQLSYTSSYDFPNEKSEYRLVSNWLNDQKLPINTIVFIYDPNITNYFVYNQKTFFDLDSLNSTPQNIYDECADQISCVINKKYNIKDYQFLIISTSGSSIKIDSTFDKYTSNQHHLMAFQDHVFSNSNNFKLITNLNDQDNWAKIYKYIP